MTLEEFLNQTNPEEYDFKNEMLAYYKAYEYLHKRNGETTGSYKKVLKHANDVIEEKDDSLEKWLKYKTDPYSGGAFDCDNSNLTCQLTEEIYRTLWGWEASEKKNPPRFRKASHFCQNEILFGGDTINSVATTLDKYTGSTVKLLAQKNADELKALFETSELYEKWKEFAKLTSSIGNFTLVPAGFNTFRYCKTKDYWDLSLLLLGKAILPENITWNQEYFKRYINVFFLWDYMENDNMPAPLFESHKPLLSGSGWGHNYRIISPQDIYDYAGFLDVAKSRIQRRGAFMVAMLRIATNYNRDYKKVMEYLCKLGTTISSCEAACEQLEKDELELSKDAKEIIDVALPAKP